MRSGLPPRAGLDCQSMFLVIETEVLDRQSSFDSIEPTKRSDSTANLDCGSSVVVREPEEMD